MIYKKKDYEKYGESYCKRLIDWVMWRKRDCYDIPNEKVLFQK